MGGGGTADADGVATLAAVTAVIDDVGIVTAGGTEAVAAATDKGPSLCSWSMVLYDGSLMNCLTSWL